MQSAEAVIETEQASRYLVQFCRHAQQMGGHLGGPLGHLRRAMDHGAARPELQHVEWTETNGTIVLNWGQCTMEASPEALRARAEATDEENLKRIQDLVTTRLESFGRRGNLRVVWRLLSSPDGA
jgi:hypothetical protein